MNLMQRASVRVFSVECLVCSSLEIHERKWDSGFLFASHRVISHSQSISGYGNVWGCLKKAGLDSVRILQKKMQNASNLRWTAIC
jgi:hypothetical protein